MFSNILLSKLIIFLDTSSFTKNTCKKAPYKKLSNRERKKAKRSSLEIGGFQEKEGNLVFF